MRADQFQNPRSPFHVFTSGRFFAEWARRLDDVCKPVSVFEERVVLEPRGGLKEAVLFQAIPEILSVSALEIVPHRYAT